VIAFTVQAIWVRLYQGASVPFGDEWDGLVHFLEQVRAGQLSWHLMFETHMEHRIPVARAFFLLTYWVFGETSLLACLLISAALMGLLVGIWTYTLRRLCESIWVIAATVFVLMSPSQFHNILWPFQIEFYTLVGSVIAAICWIALAPRVTWGGVVGCAAACAISLYSIVSGALSWAVVGPGLFLRTLSEHRSIRSLLTARREWLQMTLFVALGLFVSALYFAGYEPTHPRAQTPQSAMQFLVWFSASIVYPLVDIHMPSEVWWLPFIVCAVFVPIGAALVLYWVRRDTPRFVLVAGLVLNVLLNMAVIAGGRGAAPFIAPRYGTVALWSSAASLVAIASLWRETIRTRWRWIAAPALFALTGYLLYAHAWRYYTYTQGMKEWGRTRGVFEQNVRTYALDGAPDRQLAAFLPFPVYIIKPMLDRSSFMVEMPYNLRPAARFTKTGDAWSAGGLPPSLEPPADTFVFGSAANAARTGTLTSTGFHPRGALVLHVAGYPTRGGNSLILEATSDPARRIVFNGPDPGERWAEWRIEPSQLPARRIRIVAVKANSSPADWFGVGLPADKPASVGRLEAFVAHLEWWTMPVAAALGLWSAIEARRRRVRYP
jgi:hypothetical protein